MARNPRNPAHRVESRRTTHRPAATFEHADAHFVSEAPAPPPALFEATEVRIRAHAQRPGNAYVIEHPDGSALLIADRDSRLGERFSAIMIALGVLLAAGLPVVMLASVQMNTALQLGVLTIGLALSAVVALVFLLGLYPRRHVRMYVPGLPDRPASADVYLTVIQDSATPFLVRSFTVADADLQLVGWISRSFIRDGLFRTRWHCYDDRGVLQCIVTEDAALKTLLRYVFNAVGGSFMPADFVFRDPETNLSLARLVGSSPADDGRTLDFRDDEFGQLDRRLAITMAILIEAEAG